MTANWVQSLLFDAGNVEAIACLGSYQFYSDQPEVAMIYFRRILQLGRLIIQMLSMLSNVYKHDKPGKSCSEGIARQHSCSYIVSVTANVLLNTL